MDYSSDNECISDLFKRKNHAIQCVIEPIAAVQAAVSPVCSPWQQEMDKMIAQD